ncbi:uncharacterized protein LOC131637025 [Vicia villosa]|uniref:uncharacterized protein LOC131637025 n=1 Tax=Vicia villosa TaxID=3911 RepID=UPI00273C7B1A|nr:uncharacterized protein LOC131637025 [Vicia villosa]
MVVGPDILPLFMDLRGRLEFFGGVHDVKDSVSWSLDPEKGFTVSLCYSLYAISRIPSGPLNRCDGTLEIIWKMEVPFKIKAFGWRLFVDRLPTKDHLMNHIFCKCNVTKIVWRNIASWVDFSGLEEKECLPFFMEWYSLSRVKKIKEGKLGGVLISHFLDYLVNKEGFCFRNEVWNINNMVWNIKILVWRWSSFSDITHSNYSFYDFSKDHLSSMS